MGNNSNPTGSDILVISLLVTIGLLALIITIAMLIEKNPQAWIPALVGTFAGFAGAFWPIIRQWFNRRK